MSDPSEVIDSTVFEAYVVSSTPRPLSQEDDERAETEHLKPLWHKIVAALRLYLCCGCGWFSVTAWGFAVSATLGAVGILLLVLSRQAAMERHEYEAQQSALAQQVLDNSFSVRMPDPLLAQTRWNQLAEIVTIDDSSSSVPGEPEQVWQDNFTTIIEPDSPQFQALQWMMLDDPIDLTGNWTTEQVLTSEEVSRLRQRYALATLYFQFGGASSWTLAKWTAGWLPTRAAVLALEREQAAGVGGDAEEEDMGSATMAAVDTEVDVVGWLSTSTGRSQNLSNDNATEDVDNHGLAEETDDEGDPLLSGDKRQIPLHECGWFGITCDEAEQVVSLDMGRDSGFVLAGRMPVELSWLTALQNLDASHQALMGTIPALVYQQLTALVDVDLSLNQLTALHSDIGHWTALTSLSLAQNALYGTVPLDDSAGGGGLSQLTNLKRLRLLHNPHLSSPDTTAKPGSPHFFDVAAQHWPALEYLEVSSTNISGTISSDVGRLTNLSRLGATLTSLSGSIPRELGQCTALIEIALGDALPDETGYVPPGLNGTLPTELGALTELQDLYIVVAKDIEGPIPLELGRLTALQLLDFNGLESLSGTLPTELGNLSELGVLRLHDTGLTGTVPTELGRLSKLFQMELYETSLTGTIPQEICDLKLEAELVDITADCLNDPGSSSRGPSHFVVCNCGCVCYWNGI